MLVAIGWPKGYRGSYRQWLEDDVAPHVVFEILSPSNTLREMMAKGTFYARYGAEEFYAYDPQSNTLIGWFAQDGVMVSVPDMDGFTSPRLGIRFDMSGETLALSAPDGAPFLTFPQLQGERERERARANTAEARADAAEAELVALRAKLAAQGIDPDAP